MGKRVRIYSTGVFPEFLDDRNEHQDASIHLSKHDDLRITFMYSKICLTFNTELQQYL